MLSKVFDTLIIVFNHVRNPLSFLILSSIFEVHLLNERVYLQKYNNCGTGIGATFLKAKAHYPHCCNPVRVCSKRCRDQEVDVCTHCGAPRYGSHRLYGKLRNYHPLWQTYCDTSFLCFACVLNHESHSAFSSVLVTCVADVSGNVLPSCLICTVREESSTVVQQWELGSLDGIAH